MRAKHVISHSESKLFMFTIWTHFQKGVHRRKRALMIWLPYALAATI